MVGVEEQGMITDDVVRRRVIGPVLALALNHPPVNALSAAVRNALWAALAYAEDTPAIGAVLLTGDSAMFSAGADIAEFGTLSQAPALPDLCARIEGLSKPVIVALRGHVLGGGLELALAAHYRIAEAGALLGFPEIRLGLLPGAGGTQRLPRLIGAEQALRLILSGKPVTALEALSMGLVDHVHETGLIAAALLFARQLPAVRRTLDLKVGLRDIAGYQDAVRRARKRLAAISPTTRSEAPSRIVDCVEAALLLPAGQALDFERSAFGDLLASTESMALRHLFRAERQSAALPAAVAALPAPQLTMIGLWGAGEDSADLVGPALSAGLAVLLAYPDRDALVAALRSIAGRAEALVGSGLLTPEARDADWARLSTAMTADALNGVDLIMVRAGAPSLPPALAIRPQVGLGGLPVGATAGVAMAFAPGRLVELALGGDSPVALAALAAALARQVGERRVVVGPGGTVVGRLGDKLLAALDFLRSQGIGPDGVERVAQGLAGGPMTTRDEGAVRICLAALANEGARMVESGTVRRPADIDVIAVTAGIMPREMGGPMFQADRRGLLVVRADLTRLAAQAPDLFSPAQLFSELIAKGKTLGHLNR